jgi:hypothetical protein
MIAEFTFSLFSGPMEVVTIMNSISEIIMVLITIINGANGS